MCTKNLLDIHKKTFDAGKKKFGQKAPKII